VLLNPVLGTGQFLYFPLPGIDNRIMNSTATDASPSHKIVMPSGFEKIPELLIDHDPVAFFADHFGLPENLF